jgi:hypothetical protein
MERFEGKQFLHRTNAAIISFGSCHFAICFQGQTMVAWGKEEDDLSHNFCILTWLLDVGFFFFFFLFTVHQGTCGPLPNAALKNSVSQECKSILE